ncbi:MAG: ROK family protein [Actinobacteria bacterium]|nr:ROK family protein [Actinomycetota bacterium]
MTNSWKDSVVTRFLGLDLGGTNIKVAVIEKSGDSWKVIKEEDVPTEADKGPAHVVSRLAEIAANKQKEFSNLSGVGVAVPGLFNADGTIELFPNLPGAWRGFQALEPIRKATNLPTAIINDARSFTLGEAIMGAALGKRTVACFVMGTGVGGGVVIDGKIHLGASGAAGEIAHQIIKFDGPICGCGAQGCAEPLTNSAAIAKLAGTKTAEAAYKNAVAGDEKALAAFKEVAYWIAITLTNIMVVLAPDTIVIGGGVAQSGDILLKEIRTAMHERAHLYPASDINIVPATLGFYAGSIGAALYGAITAGAQLSLISTT